MSDVITVRSILQKYSLNDSMSGNIQSIASRVYSDIRSLGFEINLSFPVVILIFATSSLVGALSMLPGGIGITEGGMVGLLLLQGIDYTQAFSVIYGPVWVNEFSPRDANTKWMAVLHSFAVLGVMVGYIFGAVTVNTFSAYFS